MNIGYVVMEVLNLHFKNKDHISAVDWNVLIEKSPCTAKTIADAHEMTLSEFRAYISNQWIVYKSTILKAFERNEPKPEYVEPPPLIKIEQPRPPKRWFFNG